MEKFEMIADRPCLDFVATKAERGTNDLEGLVTANDLKTWARESGLVDGLGLVTAEQVEHARRVRDAIFRLLAALIDGTAAPPQDRLLVNSTAARPRPTLTLTSSGQVTRRGYVDALLSVLAADCLDLYDSPDRELLHWCADQRCTRPFVDRSRGARRRWCGMKGCGDRAKASAYRERRRHQERAVSGLRT